MVASRGKSKRVIRHKRVRQKISGTSGRPRFSVYRSLKNIYVQVIDDQLGTTIASASSVEEEIRNKMTTRGCMLQTHKRQKYTNTLRGK